MNRVYVRPVRKSDEEKFNLWSKLNYGRNAFDSGVAGYPSTFALCAYDKDGPLAFLPIQQPLMMDSLATRPGATEREVSHALRELLMATVMQGHIKGAGEIYFLGTDPDTNEFAKLHDFEELPWKVYRLKVADTECK